MALITGINSRRSSCGTTLTELLITSLLLGITVAAIGELVSLNTFAIWKTTNKSDATNSVRWAIERISADVRKARCVGDHYATSSADLNQFPADSGNPLYATQVPAGGWPWSGPPYLLNPQCLILQTPVLFENQSNSADPRNGFPSMIPTNSLGSGIPVADLENLETVIYQVVADPLIPGEYMIQVVRLPGAPIYNYITGNVEQAAPSAVNPPQTVIRGIVGPLVNGSTVPSVFNYYQSSTGSPPSLLASNGVVPATAIPSISGVAIDIEVLKPSSDSSSKNLPYQETMAVHAEAQMRYNKNIVMTNFSPRQ